jgi:hypothetical protein
VRLFGLEHHSVRVVPGRHQPVLLGRRFDGQVERPDATDGAGVVRVVQARSANLE